MKIKNITREHYTGKVYNFHCTPNENYFANGVLVHNCYKNNSDKPATNMSLADFKKVVGKFPRNLSQIALGITGVQTNPDFIEMLRWLREDMGIVPNYTLSGADMNDEIFEATLKYCGRVAVSVYETDKNLCYNTIKRFNRRDNLLNLLLVRNVTYHLVVAFSF